MGRVGQVRGEMGSRPGLESGGSSRAVDAGWEGTEGIGQASRREVGCR